MKNRKLDLTDKMGKSILWLAGWLAGWQKHVVFQLLFPLNKNYNKYS